MKRLFWLGIGIGVGVSLTRRTRQARERLTPAGIGANLGDGLRELGAGIGAFGAEVRAGMAEREQELNQLVEQRTGMPRTTFTSALAGDTDPAPTPRRARAAGA